MAEIKHLLKKTIAYHPLLAEIFGGIKEAVYLQQIIFWHDKGNREDGLIYKTIKEFEEETYIKKGAQERIRNRFVEMGIIETQILKVKGTPKTHFKLHWDILETHINAFLESPKTGKSEKPKIGKTDLPKIGKTSITENTSENTSELRPKGTQTKTEGKIINEVLEYFKDVNPSYDRLYRMKPQREALDRLIVKHGKEEIIKIIEFLKISNTHTYAPKITTPYVLELKLGDLKAWADGQKAKAKSKGREILVA